MIPFIGPIIELVGSLGSSWMDKKKIEATEKVKIARARVEGEIDWDIAQARASANSFKDEFLVIIFTCPLVMCFIPGLEKYAVRGFDILATLPSWYQGLLAVMVAASFGFRGATKFMNRKK